MYRSNKRINDFRAKRFRFVQISCCQKRTLLTNQNDSTAGWHVLMVIYRLKLEHIVNTLYHSCRTVRKSDYALQHIL